MDICFTGHRPNKLGGYDWNTPKNKMIMGKIRDTVIDLINTSGETEFTFFFGAALGIDQMAFEIVREIRDKLKLSVTITLILAMPFEKQDNNWFKQEDKDRLKSQRKNADQVVLVDTLTDYKFDGVPVGEYHPAKMQLRNQFMVDHVIVVIAVWDGSKGGTGNCVKYAKSKGRRIIVIDPNK
jgi:uncharacterized phage-like protein YoqJ